MTPADDGFLALDHQLCFALYAASRAMTKAYGPLLQALGVTYPQYLVLLVLWEWDGQGEEADNSVGALGRRLMLDSGTLTPLLKRMEERGLVVRQRAPWDERVTLVAITDAGRALKPRARALLKQLLDTAPVSQRELAKLHRQLWRFLEKFQVAS